MAEPTSPNQPRRYPPAPTVGAPVPPSYGPQPGYLPAYPQAAPYPPAGSSYPQAVHYPRHPAGYPPAPPGYPPVYLPRSAPGTDGFAIASLILGIVGGFLLSVVFGFVALSRIKRTGQGGRGLAIAGLVLSGLWVAIVAIAVAVAVATSADRSADGMVVGAGSVSAMDLRIGDCITNPAAGSDSREVLSVAAVPCSQPHTGEVYALFDLPSASYPGEAAVFSQAETRCVDLVAGYSPRPRTPGTSTTARSHASP